MINDPAKSTAVGSIDKRKRSLLLAMGAIVGGATATKLLNNKAIAVATSYTPKEGGTVDAGKLFDERLMADLKAICQTIIPRTDTLGAGDVDVHGFIDNQLVHCYEKTQQDDVKQVIVEVGKQHKDGFMGLTHEKQKALLIKLDNQDSAFSETLTQGFKTLKSLVIFGYYTSQEGASKELKYLAFPGPFKGSVPYKSVGRGYGSFAYY